MSAPTRAAVIIAVVGAHESLLAPARAGKDREKAIEIVRRQAVDAGGPRAAPRQTDRTAHRRPTATRAARAR